MDKPVVNIAAFAIDDDPDTLNEIEQVIHNSGIENYNLFTNEDDFINGLTGDIHVCIVDHLLVRKTGLDILKAVKEKNEFSFVIAYTGVRDPEIIEKYLNGGANRFVDKNKKHHLQLLTQFLREGLNVAKKNLEFSNYLKGEMEKIKCKDRETASANR